MCLPPHNSTTIHESDRSSRHKALVVCICARLLLAFLILIRVSVGTRYVVVVDSHGPLRLHARCADA